MMLKKDFGDIFFNYDDESDVGSCPITAAMSDMDANPILYGFSGVEQKSHGKEIHEVKFTQSRDTKLSSG
jgi:hypothetical protein